MKKLIIILLANICISTLFSQGFIAVQNNSEPILFLSLDSAINYASNGDTIFIPGGSFNVAENISKCIHFIGVGHNQDSCVATNKTFISGNINLIAGADGGSMTGLYILGEVNFGNTPSSGCANNYSIMRCRISNISSQGIGYSYSPVNNIFNENIIITSVDFRGGQYNFLFNNILSYLNQVGSYCTIKNNIFLGWPYNLYAGGSYSNFNTCLFENNIFLGGNVFYNIQLFSNNVFNNNIFQSYCDFPFNYSNIGSNNIFNQNVVNIFVNINGPFTNFEYINDYHLQSNSPGKNAGTDGTDIGIYGGLYPWKDGSIPFNPHIQQKTVSGTTDQNGNLNVNIKVEAQDH
jgi:hypothetical protein